MNNTMGYVRGLALMLLICMPLTLFLDGIIMWLDPEETNSFVGVLQYNSIPLYFIGLIPMIIASVGHTALMRRERGTAANLFGQSLLMGCLMGAGAGLTMAYFVVPSFHVLAVLVSWPIALWGLLNGGFYGLLVGLFGREKEAIT